MMPLWIYNRNANYFFTASIINKGKIHFALNEIY